MPLVTVKFEPDLYRDPQSNKLEVIYRPYVLVKIGNNSKWSKNFIRALVDSGADSNVFPSSYASEIGINYKKGRPWKIFGVGTDDAKGVNTYINFVKIKMGTKILDTVIQFGDDIKIPLLGRDGFFNYFERITINVKRKIIELKY